MGSHQDVLNVLGCFGKIFRSDIWPKHPLCQVNIVFSEEPEPPESNSEYSDSDMNFDLFG